MDTNFLSELNEVQREAVTTIDGPMLVIAGAGSGKTRVLTCRIANLLQKGIRPSNILALTFTNKAANEMKNRIADITSQDTARYLWMGTFHSIFARILRFEAEKIGYKKNFTIYDAADSKNLVKTIIKEKQLDDNVYKPNNMAARISAAKNDLVTSRMYAANNTFQEYDKMSRTPLFYDIYMTYTARCFKANAMDFDDLLLNMNVLFRDFPDVLTSYQKRFPYILVDEYQDTNYSQYLIVKRLAEPHNNICVVGDDAQSIYSFRGARIENILNFKTDYPDYKLFKLEQNYRSTQTIVNAANSIIANNEEQIKKNVFSKNEEGEKINLFQTMTDVEEGVVVVSDIFQKRMSQHLDWTDFAILYRTNAQSRIFEEMLRKKRIPFKIYGGQLFYDRKEIKDFIAYLRLIVNKADEEAFKRIINYPKRGIGDTTVERILTLASDNGLSAWDIVSNIDSYHDIFNGGTISKIKNFVDLINSLSADVETINAYEVADNVADRSGILRELRKNGMSDDLSRYENVEELLNGIKIFTEDAETNGDPVSLEAYLLNVALLTDLDNDKDEDADTVTLMTIHSAKGLEFNQVYIVGMEDSLFPSPMSNGLKKELEEERRLFYVAVTRARKQVTLSYASNRYKWGNLEISGPSRFLREIEPKYLNYPQRESVLDQKTAFPRQEKNTIFHASQPEQTFVTRKKLSRIDNQPSKESGLSVVNNTTFAEGDAVMHDKFGKGIIVCIEGVPPNNTATVEFDKGGRKKLLLRFAKLTKM